MVDYNLYNYNNSNLVDKHHFNHLHLSNVFMLITVVDVLQK